MHRIDATTARAEDVLEWLGRHVPPGADLGTPKIVVGSGSGSVLTADGATTALISLADDFGSVTRMAELPGGLVEVTSWTDGAETGRWLIPVTGDDDEDGDGRPGCDPAGPQPYTGPPGGAEDPEFAMVPVRRIAG